MQMKRTVNLARAILYFIATVLIYLGVCLLGWGLGNLGGFFASGPRFGYAIIVGIFGLVVGMQAYHSIEGIRGGTGEKSKFVFRQRIVRVMLIFSLYTALFFIPYFDRHEILVFGKQVFVQWLGVILSTLGFGLVYLSGQALGRQYSQDVTIQINHRLITNGVYRFIRHPRYLGVMALSLGVSCVFRSWIGLAASVIFLTVILYRIKDEEILMHQEFGTAWEIYKKHSWRLIPYIF